MMNYILIYLMQDMIYKLSMEQYFKAGDNNGLFTNKAKAKFLK